MLHRETVLVVDDNGVNRNMLAHILSGEYTVLQAENGRVALDVLAQHPHIAAVLLDLVMPVMGGYAFLEILRSDAANEDLPVIVSTAASDRINERRALKLGAWDFVSKPYDPDIIRLRLKNVIARSRQAAQQELAYLALHDPLTGLYNSRSLYAAIRRLLAEAPAAKKLALVRFDIDQFKLINTLYGRPMGDRLLRYCADCLRELLAHYSPCCFGRTDRDVFYICMPFTDEDSLLTPLRALRQKLEEFPLEFFIKPSFGICRVADRGEEIDSLYQKCTLAAAGCKNQYRKFYCYFSEDMAENLLESQQVLNDIAPALAQRQFVLYFQPKVEIRTGQAHGAEALVRWQHPRRGLISPSRFVPLFESNGFITELDYYLWEEVCRQLHAWLRAGLEPYPVSVNISRVSMYMPQLVDMILGLVKKYEIPAGLLALEITESAYISSPEIAIQKLRALHDHGFTVMMDDFGSGYSSLNMLKDIPADVLKLDIGFLSSVEIGERSAIILRSIMEMAKRLNMVVIAEGVETREQYEFYKAAGCDYIQGYLFSAPVPLEKYAQICGKNPIKPAMQD